jgi:HD-like signal output (HDOD) protein
MANATDTKPVAATQESVSAEAMRFVERLSADVAGDAIELPSYPEVALRVQRVLVDADAGTERVVKVVSSEPMLASRILAVANSAAMNRSGRPISDLRAAAVRVGFDTLRTVAIGFAVAQLRKAAAFRSIDKPMNLLWQQSVGIAAMSFVLSRKLQRFVPDVAMLAGLVSGVGKLYILTRSTQYPGLFSDPASYHSVEREWHSQVARSILENWKLAPEIIEAVGDMEEAALDDRGVVRLSDLLSAAQLLDNAKSAPDVLDAVLSQNNACLRLGLTAASCQVLLAESAAELASLTDALGK